MVLLFRSRAAGGTRTGISFFFCKNFPFLPSVLVDIGPRRTPLTWHVRKRSTSEEDEGRNITAISHKQMEEEEHQQGLGEERRLTRIASRRAQSLWRSFSSTYGSSVIRS